MSQASSITTCCPYCGDDEQGLIKDRSWGWICDSCLAEYERIDRETDWESWDEDRRRKIAEANEY